MTASELIAELSKLPPDTPVYVWKGDRHEALDIDDSLSCWIRDLLTSTQENEDEIIRTICP